MPLPGGRHSSILRERRRHAIRLHFFPRSWRDMVWVVFRMTLVFLLAIAFTRLAFVLGGGPPSLFWPTNGVVIMFLTNSPTVLDFVLTTCAGMAGLAVGQLHLVYVGLAFQLATANSIEFVVASILMRSLGTAPIAQAVKTVRFIIVLVFGAGVFASGIGATAGAFVLHKAFPGSMYSDKWIDWFVGDLTGNFIAVYIGSLVVANSSRRRFSDLFKLLRTRSGLMYAALFLAGSTMVATVYFLEGLTAINAIPLLLLTTPALGNLALVLPQVVSAAMDLVLVLSAVLGTRTGRGPLFTVLDNACSDRQERDIFVCIQITILLSTTLTATLAVAREQRVASVNRDKAASDEKLAFFTHVSHEFRTPLSVVIGYTEDLLSNQDLPLDVWSDLESIHYASISMSAMVEDLLSLFRLETHGLVLCARPVQTEEFFKKIASFATRLSSTKTHKITVDKCLPPVLVFDSNRMQQVVINLVSNAVKFTPRGGEITISASLKPTNERSSSGEDTFLSRSRGGSSSSNKDAGIPHATIKNYFNGRADGTDEGDDKISTLDLEGGRADSTESELVQQLASTGRGGERGGTSAGVSGGGKPKDIAIDMPHPGTPNDGAGAITVSLAGGGTTRFTAATDTSNRTISGRPPVVAVDTAFSDAVEASSSLHELDDGEADAPTNNIGGAMATSTTAAYDDAAAAVTAGGVESSTSSGVHSSCNITFMPQTEDSTAQGGDGESIRRLLIISVRDTGVGMKPEDLPRLFDRFFRCSNSVAEGTGLGLTICKNISEAMGGNLAVSSIVGTGTTFTMTVPVAVVVGNRPPALTPALDTRHSASTAASPSSPTTHPTFGGAAGRVESARTSRISATERPEWNKRRGGSDGGGRSVNPSASGGTKSATCGASPFGGDGTSGSSAAATPGGKLNARSVRSRSEASPKTLAPGTELVETPGTELLDNAPAEHTAPRRVMLQPNERGCRSRSQGFSSPLVVVGGEKRSSVRRQKRPDVNGRSEKKKAGAESHVFGGDSTGGATVKDNAMARQSLFSAATAGGGGERDGDERVINAAAAGSYYIQGDGSSSSTTTGDDDKPFCLRILLAEDSIPNQKLMSRILERAGHTVESVEDGQDALDALASGRFELLVLDLGLPTKTGLQVLTEIRAMPAGSRVRNIPVIVSSGHVLDEHRKLCLESGCNAFTEKPFRAKIIVDTVQRVMREHTRAASRAALDRPPPQSD